MSRACSICTHQASKKPVSFTDISRCPRRQKHQAFRTPEKLNCIPPSHQRPAIAAMALPRCNEHNANAATGQTMGAAGWIDSTVAAIIGGATMLDSHVLEVPAPHLKGRRSGCAERTGREHRGEPAVPGRSSATLTTSAASDRRDATNIADAARAFRYRTVRWAIRSAGGPLQVEERR